MYDLRNTDAIVKNISNKFIIYFERLDNARTMLLSRLELVDFLPLTDEIVMSWNKSHKLI